ncbi:MAG: cation transporter [Clostridia bacterium]|nr:cation transporter [Clostridia bacterium]
MVELLSRWFVKNHEQIENPRVRASYGTMVSVVGIVLNLLLSGAKIAVGALFASLSILADGVNNLSDAGSQLISLLSFRIAAKPADREHPFGHARIEYVASMIVSFLILLVGAELLKESIRKIITPEPPEASWISVAVLGGAILVKLWLAHLNRKIGKKIDSSVMRATAADSLSDVLSTGAVLIATLVSLLFPSLGWNLDAYIGVAVSLFILYSGFKIFLETKNAILGEAPSEEVVKTIESVVSEFPDALGIHDLVVHNYGPGHIIAALHIEVDGKKDVFDSHDMIDLIEHKLRNEHGIEATIHMDPILRDEETLALRKEVENAIKGISPDLRIHDFRLVKGPTHSNLIFDVAVPFEIKASDSELKDQISSAISTINPTYFAVIQVDRV